MIVPLYQAELAHPDIRGLVVGLQQFMLGIGGVCGSVGLRLQFHINMLITSSGSVMAATSASKMMDNGESRLGSRSYPRSS